MSDKRPVDELFSEEELPLPPIENQSRPKRGGGLWVAIVLVVLLLGGVFWFFSDAQHGLYFLRVKDSMVNVERGLFFPWGTSDWRPNRAYAPFRLPEGIEPGRTGDMTVEELDATLFNLFQAIASRELRDLKNGDVNLADDMLLRALKLGHITDGDDSQLLRMRGDVAFRRGLLEIRGVQARFDEALKQFRLAAMREGSVYSGATRWVEAIHRLREEFRVLSLESGLDPDRIVPTPPVAPPPTALPPQVPPTPPPNFPATGQPAADERLAPDAGLVDGSIL